ncbi:MAG: hypothetical protein CFE45_43015 [Burkholderiales bacterium PBB5]|nr:MAG: hypothetical protein CFE45_43015 [Burkholderiales bacterium PBB5]
MSTPTPVTRLTVPAALQPLAGMALLLEKLERSPREASAAQYRGVAQQITALLQAAEPGPELNALLSAFPASAELYENLHYAQAGLCRSPLEASLNAELDARAALRRLAGPLAR